MTDKKLFWLSVAVAILLTAVPDMATARELHKNEPGFRLPLMATYTALCFLFLYALSEVNRK